MPLFSTVSDQSKALEEDSCHWKNLPIYLRGLFHFPHLKLPCSSKFPPPHPMASSMHSHSLLAALNWFCWGCWGYREDPLCRSRCLGWVVASPPRRNGASGGESPCGSARESFCTGSCRWRSRRQGTCPIQTTSSSTLSAASAKKRTSPTLTSPSA